MCLSPSSASANICNVGLMRHNELSEGIDVMDDNGTVVGSSKIAAKHVSVSSAYSSLINCTECVYALAVLFFGEFQCDGG